MKECCSVFQHSKTIGCRAYILDPSLSTTNAPGVNLSDAPNENEARNNSIMKEV